MTAARSRSAGLPDVLPVLPLRSTVVYPKGVVGVQIDTPASLEVLASNPGANLVVAVVVAVHKYEAAGAVMVMPTGMVMVDH